MTCPVPAPVDAGGRSWDSGDGARAGTARGMGTRDGDRAKCPIRPSPSRASPAEVEALDLGVGEEGLAGALEAVLAELQHVAAVGRREGTGRVLLDHHQRVA